MLVKPLIPTHLYSLIGSAKGIKPDSVSILEQALEQMLDEKFDENIFEQLRELVSEIESSLAESKTDPAKSREKAAIEKLLFGAYLCTSLLNIRLHAIAEAKAAAQKAKLLFKSPDCSLDKRIALESLGLLEALVDELEERLSRIEPCIFSRRFFFDK